MVRFVLAIAVCFLAIQQSPAATPAVKTSPSPAARSRSQIEALLQSPANLDFGKHTTVTVGELLDLLHKQHHLSIRFDIPSLANMYGLGVGGGAEKMVARHSSRSPAPAASYAACAPATSPLATLTQTLAKPVQQSAFYPPQETLPASGYPAANPYSNAPTAPKRPQSASTAAPPSKNPQPPAAPAAYPTTGYAAPTIPALSNGPAPPEACHAPEPSAATVKEAPTPKEFFDQAAKIEVPVATIDGRTITVATALRLALDAFPNISAEDSPGLPLAMTDAGLLDFLVEDDGILITTRLKALTYKETRVYSIKNLKGFNPQDLSTVICQSIRPWSWRSRIDEFGEQLKGGTTVPPTALAYLAKSAMQLASEETGLPINISDKADADSADGAKAGKKTTADEMQEAAMLGNAVANGLVTLAHTALTTLEIVHYADPPTGTIRVLPGKLVITQSQAAHREIAELLKQLSDE